MPEVLEESYKDVAEKFNPGELAGTSSSQIVRGSYGDRNEFIPEEYQNELRRIVESIQTRDLFARITEVRRSAQGCFYLRNIFDAFWSDAQDTWVVGGMQPGDRGASSQLNYPLNIYQAFERSFVKLVGHKPCVHFTTTGNTSRSMSIADAADNLLKDVEQANEMRDFAQDFARISYTDGRYGIYTRWVADAARFGTYEEDEEGQPEGVGEGGDPPKKTPRHPKGNVKYDIYGTPWLKVPINAKSITECAWLSLGDEVDINNVKSTYPHIADEIDCGQPGPGEFMFERTTRIALIQGIHLVSQMAEAEIDMPTMQTVWLRPSMFVSITDEKKRSWFLDNYPNGCKVVFVGNAYAESSNESMDRHWSIGQAVRGPGMMGIPYGYSMLTTQDAYNDVFDLEMETHMRAIPAIYLDPQVFDLPARSKEPAVPGMAYALKHDLDPAMNVQQKMVQEPAVVVSQQLINLRDSLPTTISSTITGISPAAVGQSDEANQTLGGITILRAAARGETGTVFTGFVEAYSRSAQQAVRIAAKFRAAEAQDGRLSLKRRGLPDLDVDLVELQMADFWCEPDSDQSYPSTHEEEAFALTQLTMAAQMGDQQAAAMLNDPANAARFAQLRGISGAKSSTGLVGAKVNQLIQFLLSEEPQQNQQAIQMLQQQMQQAAMQAAAQGQPMPQPNEEQMQQMKYQLFKSSRIPSPLDQAELEFPFFMEWMYSPAGQLAKETNETGFFNVELYAMQLQQKTQQNQQNAMQQQIVPQLMIEKAKKAPTQKSPGESINFKDLGPWGRLQLARQAGIDITADVSSDLAHEQMGSPEPANQPRKLRR
jgi:hypothetical protein